jgi:hypothetical protein
MSTGLIVMGDDEGERGALAKKSFGVVILDEAHKARASRGLQGRDPPKPNNLLVFLRAVARNAQNVILGSATPIQLNAVELWDLLSALSQSAPQVLGTHMVLRGCLTGKIASSISRRCATIRHATSTPLPRR